MASIVPLVAKKTITNIQVGSRYKERYTMPKTLPVDTTVRQVWYDSTGAALAEVVGEVEDGHYLVFTAPYSDVAEVPNGAGFYCYIQMPDADGEDMVRYGTTFRRELTFPDSPANVTSTVVRLFEDNFQRRAGAVGGKWKVLVGRPKIFDNTEWFGFGQDHPNTVGPDFNFFSRYAMRFYQPFNDDSMELSISATDKGSGKTIVALCANSMMSSYLYLGFDSQANTVELGVGHSPDIGSTLSPTDALDPKIAPVALTVPGDDGLATYKLRYDDVTSTITMFNENGTDVICEWTDDADEVPHGKGYRYFGLGGNSGLFDSGVQLAYVRAAGIV